MASVIMKLAIDNTTFQCKYNHHTILNPHWHVIVNHAIARDVSPLVAFKIGASYGEEITYRARSIRITKFAIILVGNIYGVPIPREGRSFTLVAAVDPLNTLTMAELLAIRPGDDLHVIDIYNGDAVKLLDGVIEFVDKFEDLVSQPQQAAAVSQEYSLIENNLGEITWAV